MRRETPSRDLDKQTGPFRRVVPGLALSVSVWNRRESGRPAGLLLPVHLDAVSALHSGAAVHLIIHPIMLEEV
jgi:hypothetical protein